MVTLSREHGGVYLQAGAALDFSANLNPYGPPSSVLDAVRGAAVTSYPDPECRELRRKYAERLNVDHRQVLFGNGSTELLFLLANAYGRRRGLLFTPCFGEYEAALRAAGGDVLTFAAGEPFQWDFARAAAAIREQRPGIAFIGCPNNPTGVYPDRDAVRSVAAAMGDGVLVLDEAFVDFVDSPWRSLRLAPNVVVVRSLTKMFTIPGVRAGYLVGPRRVVETVAALQPAWSVGAAAQAALDACLAETGFAEASRRRLAEDRASLAASLRALGLPVQEGAANFVLVAVGDARKAAAALLRLGVAVRDCTSFGLPGHVRLAVRTPRENDILIGALRKVVHAG
jgi:histidinol-phosphate aminotransferase